MPRSLSGREAEPAVDKGVSMFQDKGGFLHRLDPRVKIVWMLISFALVMLYNDPFFVGAVYLVNILLGILSKMPGKAVWALIWTNVFFILITIVMWPLYLREGPVLFTVGKHYVVTLTALKYAFAVGFRLVVMYTTSTVFIFTTPAFKMVTALEQMHLPSKACLAASMMIRFIPVIRDEGLLILEAQKSRGLDLESGSVVQKVKKYVPVSIPIFLRSFTISQKLALAMDARGYGISQHPTQYMIFQMNWVDKVFLWIWVGALIFGIVGRITGIGICLPSML